MGLVAACVALVVRSGEPGDQPLQRVVPPAVRLLTWGVIASTAVVVFLGVITTGSGPHSGDADVEARFSFDPRTVAWLHADSVFLFLGLTIGLLVAATVVHAPGSLARRTWILLGIALIQGVVGYTQYFTGLPELLVVIHVLGAIGVWIAALFVPYAIRRRGEVDDETRSKT
jgi:cytochrome c oxidase assembly protein subunit 15